MRLNRFLAQCGLASRRACEDLILTGRVTVNGRPVEELATIVEDTDRVEVDGKEVAAERTMTLALHKPPGVLCTKKDPKGRMTIYNLLPPQHQHLHYVGRLDNESEGLLIMTNDGKLTQRLTHPSHKVDKEYLVQADHPVRSENIARLLKGIPLEEGLARAAAIHTISPRRFAVILQQGMNRQIRRMFEAIGFKVEHLVRVRIGGLTLDNLKPGKWRILRPDEIARLQGGTDASIKVKRSSGSDD
jgi:23S rRNA pseudouridine2605 synthase